MVRYLMSFTVPKDMQQRARTIIHQYFEDLTKHGPGGMRSQCYADFHDECKFVHIKSFKKESVANQHFKTASFRQYTSQLAGICGSTPSFSKLEPQKTFESIY